MGRGLHKIEHKSEKMLLQLWETLNKNKNISTRRAAILKVEENNKTHLALIKIFFGANYDLPEVNLENLSKTQVKRLQDDILKKSKHEKIIKANRNEMVDIKSSSIWLYRGNNSLTTEA